MQARWGILPLLILSCSLNYSGNTSTSNRSFGNKPAIDSSGTTIETRFRTPERFQRIAVHPQGYGQFLRSLPLFPPGHQVRYYNGEKKGNPVYDAVIQMDVGKRDLQQCADAVMRLRGEYLFARKRKDEISFRFLGDGKMHSFNKYAGGDTSYRRFRKYMDYVFAYANTASLKRQLHTKPASQVSIGDVLIQSGQPYGHAVTIVDMCIDTSGNKLVLLAQSYMPAQEIHILKNPEQADQSPWYSLKKKTIHTPEWTFDSSDLRHF